MQDYVPGLRGKAPGEGRNAVTSNGKVAEEEPATDQGLLGAARGLVHDVQVRGVKAQGGGWEPISHQVHPQELHRNQGFRETQGSCEEDTVGKGERERRETKSEETRLLGSKNKQP